MQATLRPTAGCTTGMLLQMIRSCAQRVGMCLLMVSGRHWRLTWVQTATVVLKARPWRRRQAGILEATARMTLGFRPFRAATAATALATSTVPGATAIGGVLRQVVAMLGAGTWTTSIQSSTGTTPIHGAASRSGVLGMPTERSEGGLTL